MTLSPYHSYRRPDAEDIWALYQARRAAQGPVLQQAREVQALMNNELVVPLPELTNDERHMVANLASRGMKQMAARIASVDPVMDWPVLRPGVDASHAAARTRRLLTQSWQHENDGRILRTQRAMRLMAYACAPTVIKPWVNPRDPEHEMPKWFNRHPLYTFPAECEFNDYLPSDVIFLQTHSWGWLRDKYPDQCARIKKPFNFSFDPGDSNSEITFDVLEYMDDHITCLILIAPDEASGDNVYGHASVGSNAEFLECHDNFAMHPLCVSPGAINLDKKQGEYDGIIGMYQAQSALMALTVVAQRRSVFQREWAVSNPNEQVQVISIPDPASGRPGEIKGGQIVPQPLDPSFHADQVQDRLEHHMRQDAGLPSEFGAMSQSDNVRTGRRGAQVMGAAINFTIAQAQDIFAKSLRHENEVAIAVDKGYFNYENRKKYFIMTEGWQGEVSYQPSELWKHQKHICKYPVNGVDADTLPVVGGQRVAMHAMSRRRLMEMDPMIPDAEAEEQQIALEAITVAYMGAIQTMAANPEGPWQPVHVARLAKMVKQGDDIFEASMALQREIQEEQAQLAPDPAAAQPGLSMPGQGVEQPTSIPGQERSMGNLTTLLKGLGTTEAAQSRAAKR